MSDYFYGQPPPAFPQEPPLPAPQGQAAPYFPQPGDTPPLSALERALAADPTLGQLMPGVADYLVHVGGNIGRMLIFPGQRMQEGIEGRPIAPTSELVPWAAGTALGMVGAGTPFAARGAAGIGGGRLLQPTLEEAAAPAIARSVPPDLKFTPAMSETAQRLYPGEAGAELRQSLQGRSHREINNPETADAYARIYHETYPPPAPSIENLTVNDLLGPNGPRYKSGSRTVEDIGRELDLRGQAALTALGVSGGKIDYATATPEQKQILAQAIASEVKAAMAREGGNAADWYTGKVRDAMAIAGLLYPKTLTDPHHEAMYKAALAITSQGEKVPQNVNLADKAYQHFNENGTLPTDVAALQGTQMNSNFGKLNDLLAEHGPQGTRDFLARKMTARDLVQMGYGVGDELMTAPAHGSSIFGPKIGGGFYQNLIGNYDPIAMDLWFSRTMGRLTGNLVGRPIAGQQGKFETALAAAGQPVPPDMNGLLGTARDIMKTHEAHYEANAPAYKSGELTKSDVTKTADRFLQAHSSLNDQPLSGGHRAFLRDVMGQAKQQLANEGLPLTSADMQAILWYPEKDLYATMGGRPSKGLNVDYSSALRDLAKSRGFTDEQINQAIQAAVPAAH